jgi:phosphoesterase RecJ-like protein
MLKNQSQSFFLPLLYLKNLRLDLNSTRIRKAKELLSKKDQPIVIVTHTNPDGDALGSSLGLFGFLTYAGYTNVKVITPNSFPSFLKWMPWQEKVIIANQNKNEAEKAISEASLIFCLDFNGLGRVNGLEDQLRSSKAVKVLIDHHPQPEPDFDFSFSNTEVSSTAELVYDFIVAIGGEKLLDKKVAECLYAGIVTDTGSFSYGCNQPKTYLITANLISLGVDGEHIHRLIYDTYSVDRIRLLGYCLSQKLIVLPEQQAAYISLTKNDLEKFNHQVGDTEGVVNYAMSIENIHLAALFIENRDHIKISFRSSGNVDVNLLARNHFNGGGHRNASGGKSFSNMNDTIDRFESILKSGKL